MKTPPTPAPPKTDLKLEVVVIPVSDVDRARNFYKGLGWRLDADFTSEEGAGADDTSRLPVLRLFGKGFTTACRDWFRERSSVDDLEAARAELVGQGVDVTEAFHFEGSSLCREKGRVPGPTRKVVPISRSRHSVIPTVTAGCSNRSKRGFPDEGSAPTW